MASALRPARDADSDLARRVGAGDVAAFATLDERYRTALTRYAGTLLRRSEHDAEDVVQDVLIRALDALRTDDAPDELRPWLFRLTRNRAIDEVRRKRWGDEALDPEAIGPTGDRGDPDAVLRRRRWSAGSSTTSPTCAPTPQGGAARELDRYSPEQVAAQLGVSVAATQKLATRPARTSSARATHATRIAPACELLLDAHERGVRPSDRAVRHGSGCAACRAHRHDIRRLSRQLQALNPAFGLPLIAAVAKILGAGGAKAAGGVVDRRPSPATRRRSRSTSTSAATRRPSRARSASSASARTPMARSRIIRASCARASDWRTFARSPPGELVSLAARTPAWHALAEQGSVPHRRSRRRRTRRDSTPRRIGPLDAHRPRPRRGPLLQRHGWVRTSQLCP